MRFDGYDAGTQRMAMARRMLEHSASATGLAPVRLSTPGRAPAEPSEDRVEISNRLVEEALEHLWDYSYLGSDPLAALPITRSYLLNGKGRETHIDRGMALSRLLQDAIQKLKALQPRKPSSEARLYDILYQAYVEGEKNPDVARRLGISERTFYRERRRAILVLTSVLAEMDKVAR